MYSLLQFTYKHFPCGRREAWRSLVPHYHLVCKAAWEVLLEGSRCCYWFITTTYCNTLCSIHCFINPLQDRFKVSVYKRCCQLFLDVGESTVWVLGRFGPLHIATVERVSIQQLLACRLRLYQRTVCPWLLNCLLTNLLKCLMLA